MREKSGHLSLVNHAKGLFVCFAKCNGKLLKGFRVENTFLFEKDESGVELGHCQGSGE